MSFLSPSGRIGVRVRATGIEASDIIQMAGGYGPLAGKDEFIHTRGCSRDLVVTSSFMSHDSLYL